MREIFPALLMAMLALAAAAAPGTAYGATTYHFDDASDGFTWISPLPDTFATFSGDGLDVDLYNTTGADVFIDGSFEALGQSSRFSVGNPAVWGTPTAVGGANFDIELFDTPTGSAMSVSFDFAWAIQNNQPVPDTISISAQDSMGHFVSQPFNLPDTFNTFNPSEGFGPSTGREGTITVTPGPLGLTDLEFVSLNVTPAATLGGIGIFGVDNVVISFDAAPPSDSTLRITDNGGTEVFGDNIGSNALRGSNGGRTILLFDEVTNFGPDPTTYTVQTTGLTELIPGFPQTNAPIDGNTTLSSGAVATRMDNTALSGSYTATNTLVNDLNPADPPHVVNVSFDIYDPAILTSNSVQLIDPSGVDTMSVSNADLEAHAGALRAAARITGNTIVGAGFYVDGLEVNDVIMPGATQEGVVGIDPTGLVAGLHSGSFRINLQMRSTQLPGGTPFISFLNGADPIPDIVWFLSATVDAQNTVTQNVGPGQNFGDAQLGIRNSDTSVDLIGGTSSTQQSIDAMFVGNPSPATAGLFTTPAQINFSDLADQYVLQMTYLDDSLPAGFDELDMRLLVFDPSAGAWAEAIALNSDGGAGEVFFEGSYAAFLVSIGGGPPPLSAQGVDPVFNRAWAVLDHNSTFGAGTLQPSFIPEPGTAAMLGLTVAGLMMRRRRPRRRAA